MTMPLAATFETFASEDLFVLAGLVTGRPKIDSGRPQQRSHDADIGCE